MVLDFSAPGMVEIAMKDYVLEIISNSPGDMGGTAPTPAENHLFSVNTSSASYLNELDAQNVHHIVAKLYFCAKVQDQTFRPQWLSSPQESKDQI